MLVQRGRVRNKKQDRYVDVVFTFMYFAANPFLLVVQIADYYNKN